MPETPNHNYNVPNPGDQNWHQPLNENFQQHDTDIEIRDRTQNLSDYEPKDDAKFLATDTGNVFVGDGDDWNLLNVSPSAGPPGLATNVPETTVRGYAELKDSGGNRIGGSADFDGRTDLVKVLQFDHAVDIPFNRDTGSLSGVRQHRPLTFVKPVDRATPLLVKALANGETLQEVLIHWYDDNQNEFFRHTLKDAKIANLRSFGTPPQEAISLLYRKISWLIIDGNIQITDTWSG